MILSIFPGIKIPGLRKNQEIERTSLRFAAHLLVVADASRPRQRGGGYDPLLARRFAPHNHANQADSARKSLRLSRPSRLIRRPVGRLFNRAMVVLEKLKQRARHLKAETFALYLAARDPRTPWYAKLLVAGIVAYAFSPIDLIPDFVPVLGYLDDLILIPLSITLAIKLVPHSVLTECRAQAQETIKNGKPVSRVAGAVIVVVWLVLAALCIVWGYEAFMVQP